MERTPGETAEASLPLDDAASACTAACAETAQAVDEPTEEPTFEERVARAVARIGKFRRPPEGRSFEIQIPDVVLRPLL